MSKKIDKKFLLIIILIILIFIYSIHPYKIWSWELEGDNDNVISFTREQITASGSDSPACVFRSILSQGIELFVFKTSDDNNFDNITGWWSESIGNEWIELQHITPGRVYYVEVEHDCILTISNR